MKLTINGERTDVQAETLKELVAVLGFGEAKIATAVNGDFVQASDRCYVMLQTNDHVEIVAPRQGG